VRAFVGLPAFITGIALVWLIVSRELRESTRSGMPIAVLDGRFGV
jgi:ABC-type sulfate transport system permease component